MTKNERQNNFFVTCQYCKISCCQNARPPITNKRRKIIETFLEKQRLLKENMFEHEAYIFPKENTDGYCIFYDKKTRKCKIHTVKPETCIAGPITFDINMKTRRLEWYLKKEEICPLAGVIFRNEQTLRKHLNIAKREIRRLLRELDAEALRAILKIEEPETFKIDEEHASKEVLNKLAKV